MAKPPGQRARLDFEAIARAALAAAERMVPQWLPGGKRNGREWVCGDLAGGAGESCSVNLETGAWADFAQDERGSDLISLYAAIRGIKQGEAARALASELGISSATTRAGSSESGRANAKRAGKAERRADDAEDGPESLGPRPTHDERPEAAWHDAGAWPPDGPPAPEAHVVRGRPVARWIYRDAGGGVLGYVCRFVTSTGGKEILPVVWSRHPDKGLAWRWRAFDVPRPLFALDLLAARANAPVLVVEGEKCAQAAQRVLGNAVVVTTWPGGCKAVAKADWPRLAGRRVVVWPDCDAKRDRDGMVKPAAAQPGIMAAEAIAAQLAQHRCDVRIVDVPAPGEKPDGWDVADCIAEAGGTEAPAARASVLEWLKRLRQSAAKKNGSDAALAKTEGGAPPGLGDAEWKAALRWERGGLVKHAGNITAILRNDPRWRGVIAFDEFAQRPAKRSPPPYKLGAAGEWTADDDTRTAIWLSTHWALDVSSKMVSEAIDSLAREQPFHPVVDFLRGLKWDGERRAATWLVDYVGVEDGEYAQAAGTLFLRGMVKRVIEPGCKFDYCLVLEGAEGLRKSTLAETLGCGWGSDTPLDLANNREAALAVHGNWVLEFAEMESVARAEAHLQKSFLSRRFDQYRPFWSGRTVKVPRQCVFIGTTNESEYIKEGQGARRFWPFQVARPIDIDGLRRALPQLLAEAVADLDAGERIFPSEEEQRDLFGPQQQRRVVQESLIDVLHDWVIEPDSEEEIRRFDHGGAFSLADAAWRCLKINYAQLTRDLQTRIGKALASLGCERIERRNGMTRYWYKPPAKKAATSSVPSSLPAQHLMGADDGPPF